MKLSIIHATRRGQQALNLSKKLISQAKYPANIEYIFCVLERKYRQEIY